MAHSRLKTRPVVLLLIGWLILAAILGVALAHAGS